MRLDKCCWIGLAIALAGCVQPGGGRVTNTETGLPIAGVEVRFNCQVGKLHGSTTLREVTAVTDEKGVFRFGPSDVLGCDSGVLRASKAGYVSLSAFELVWKSVDGFDFQMAPEADVNLRRLKLKHSATVKPAQYSSNSVFSSTRREYHYVYFIFIDSKNMIKTPREEAFVLENYCARLAGLWEALSPQDRIEIAQEGEIVVTGVPIKRVMIDHEGQVVAFCKKTGS